LLSGNRSDWYVGPDPVLYETPGGVAGEIGELRLGCVRSEPQGEIHIHGPALGARAGRVIDNGDGSYTTGVGSGGPRENVYYRGHLYQWIPNSGWQLAARGPWLRMNTGPWNPNVGTTSWWFNYGTSQWEFGGETVFTNVPFGIGAPTYGLFMEYFWFPANGWPQTDLWVWRYNPCGL
jgi:hypothetical protein